MYNWSPSTDLNDPNIATPMAAPDSGTVYTVTVTDVNGCVNRDTLVISTMYAQAGGGDMICPGESVQLQASSQGGTPVAYSWSPAGSLTDPTLPNPLASPVITTDYIVTVSDASGCADTSRVRVFVQPAPPADAGADVAICTGSSTQLSASGGSTYNWSPVNGLSDPTLADPVANPQADALYFVTVTDANGCTAADSVQVTVLPLPLVDAGEDQALCRTEGIPLMGSGAITYTWTPVTGLSDPSVADPIASPDVTTTYLLTGSDANGCLNTDEVTITVTQLPAATVEAPPSICLDQSALLTVSGAQEYQWSTGQDGSSITVSPANTSIFWVVPYGNGCAGDTTFFEVVVERNLPRANFVPTVSEGFAPLEVVFENTSENATRFFWDFGDGETLEDFSPLHTYELPGQYTVTLVADNDIGCPDEFVFSFIEALNFQIFFPNAFSPNGDGHNDEFIISASALASLQVQIFNRWGQIVYESDDVDFRWDGRDLRGGAVQEGVYVYRVVATSFTGQQVERGGSITLIR
jgi:gliding motility-associated-like protein